jgi:hypothetical protein
MNRSLQKKEEVYFEEIPGDSKIPKHVLNLLLSAETEANALKITCIMCLRMLCYVLNTKIACIGLSEVPEKYIIHLKAKKGCADFLGCFLVITLGFWALD